MHQVQLSIPEPCHEDWNNMTPTQQGRHCNACAKQVIDFSAMSDAQVLNYFTNIKNENVCGRAYPDQLERAIAMPVQPKKKLFWKWNYITMLFLFFSKGNTAKAQGGVKVVTTTKLDSTKPINNILMLGKVRSNVSIVAGSIIDRRGNKIAFPSIKIKGTKIGALGDENGAYHIRVNVDEDILEASAIGYQPQEIILRNAKKYDIVLDKNEEAGKISSERDLIDFSIKFEVKDNETLKPIKEAVLILKREGGCYPYSIPVDQNGVRLVKQIKRYYKYEIEIEAEGYVKQKIQIDSNNLVKTNNIKKIFLEKKPLLTDYIDLDSVIVKSYPQRTISCTTSNFSSLNGTMGGLMAGVRIKRTYVDTIKTITTKIIGDLKIFPNPVQKGNDVNLAFKLKETGEYHIQIVNAAGQMLLLKQLQPSSKNYTEQVQTNASWSSGIYYVRLLDKNNTLVSTNNFIIQ